MYKKCQRDNRKFPTSRSIPAYGRTEDRPKKSTKGSDPGGKTKDLCSNEAGGPKRWAGPRSSVEDSDVESLAGEDDLDDWERLRRAIIKGRRDSRLAGEGSEDLMFNLEL